MCHSWNLQSWNPSRYLFFLFISPDWTKCGCFTRVTQQILTCQGHSYNVYSKQCNKKISIVSYTFQKNLDLLCTHTAIDQETQFKIPNLHLCKVMNRRINIRHREGGWHCDIWWHLWQHQSIMQHIFWPTPSSLTLCINVNYMFISWWHINKENEGQTSMWSGENEALHRQMFGGFKLWIVILPAFLHRIWQYLYFVWTE